MAFTALASQTLKGKKRAENPTKFGTLSITSDMYVAFVRGMCPRKLGKEDAESVLLYIDRDADGQIGWDEFMESFISCYGRWLMRLKQTVARLADKVTNPAMKERYLAEVAKVNNVQRMMAAAFRQTKSTRARQEQQPTSRTNKTDASRRGLEKTDDDVRVISEYIDRMSDIRREKVKANSNLENTFIMNEGVLDPAVSNTALKRGAVEQEIGDIMEHAKLIAAQNRESKQIKTMYDFLVAMQEDIEDLVEESTNIKVASSPIRRARTPPPSY